MSTLNITCPVIPGNPAATEIFWTRKSDHERWNNSQLIILNVSKTDDAEYTCTVFNEMIPTVGETTKTAKTSKFHLNVFFPAFIKLFSESGKYSREDIVVNETQEVTFSCAAEANPASDITIRSPQNKTIAMVYKTNTLHSKITNLSCISAGEYICTCSNNYTNGHPSISKLTLIVRCK
ncbi:neural cell adhesion molecule 1-like [Mercenaria mercenaria]|uniref:neural cell adhesion molecule 1-like n=1 Tax=Mercenaria mercenaria TaxID=6596 RepID=UPI00234EA6CB|nr:neural cell adhesion molecule 1-like [Mercenaria mercenaria]